MPTISILIANYNNGHFFRDCFNSLLAQTHQDFEVIILDDCSTDNSFEVIKSIIGDDKRFKLFKNETNKKVGYTKRKLIELSSKEICGFLDPDDALEPQALEIVLRYHKENTEVGLIYSNFFYCDANLIKKNLHMGKQITTLNETYLNFHGEISHFATFKKTIYNKTSGIDIFLTLAEDKDWYMKMCEVAPVLYINENLYLYRIHDGGISTNRNAEKAFYWHWVALIKMSERRNKNLEEIFVNKFVSREVQLRQQEKFEDFYRQISKSRWVKLGKRLGFLKFISKY